MRCWVDPGRRAALVLLLGAALGAAPPRPAADETVAAAGHERMVRLLAEIAADRGADWNPFAVGDKLADLRRQVENLPASTDPRERLSAHAVLGREEFTYGNLQEAIRLLGGVHDAIAESDTVQRSQLAFYLGLAHLRLGERQNCLANHNADSCILPIRGGGVHAQQEGSRAAVRYFREVLSIAPPNTVEHLAAQWLLNLAYMTLGDFPDDVPAAERLPPGVFRSRVDFPRFSDVAPRLGIDVVDLAGGAVVEDLNGDGLLDILTSTWDPAGNLTYFERRRDGSFVDRTREAGLVGLTGGLNLLHADYDNDGDADVLVLRGGWLKASGRHPNSLLENDGHGRFTDVTFAAGLGEVHYPTQTAAWGDYDNDGDLDLYIGNESQDGDFPAQLFENQGDGTFTDVARRAGVTNDRYAKSVVWGDYDGDGDPDLYVSNFQDANRLYRNDGDGTFTDVAPELGLVAPRDSFVAWFWDFDNDGNLDLLVNSFPYVAGRVPQNLFRVVASYLGLDPQAEHTRLYKGNGRGFVEVAAEQGLTLVTMPMGANFGDLDNDGYLDFYLGTGYPEYTGLIPNVLYRNRRGSGFEDVTMAAGVGHLQKGHGVAFADLDNDGDQDLFEQLGGFYPDDTYGDVLFENPGFGNHWLEVRLVGVESNRSAIGARLAASVVEDGARRTVYRQVGTGASFGSSPLTQHLGLGRATEVARLEIYWPASHTTQVFEGVAADQAIEIVEGGDAYRPLERPPLPFPASASAAH